MHIYHSRRVIVVHEKLGCCPVLALAAHILIVVRSPLDFAIHDERTWCMDALLARFVLSIPSSRIDSGVQHSVEFSHVGCVKTAI